MKPRFRVLGRRSFATAAFATMVVAGRSDVAAPADAAEDTTRATGGRPPVRSRPHDRDRPHSSHWKEALCAVYST